VVGCGVGEGLGVFLWSEWGLGMEVREAGGLGEGSGHTSTRRPNHYTKDKTFSVIVNVSLRRRTHLGKTCCGNQAICYGNQPISTLRFAFPTVWFRRRLHFAQKISPH
jgi:hypothetical protein